MKDFQSIFGVQEVFIYVVVLYAMLFGTIPFKANNMTDLHNMIVKGKYKIDDTISDRAKNLLSKILEVDPKKRFTISQILSHNWFDDYNDEIKLLNSQEINQIKEEFFSL
jgi:serine/threonine protein kinase